MKGQNNATSEQLFEVESGIVDVKSNKVNVLIEK